VPASGDEHRLTYARVTTRPAYGPGGFTNDGLRKQLQTILDWTSPPTQCPKFSFQWMKVAAWKNYEVLQSYHMDIGWALAAQPLSTSMVGSEFQPTQLLEPLLSLHPLWP
jgi:hypothetical protein